MSPAGGGTRAGAHEVLKQRWVPLFARSGEGVPSGNQDLIKRGALPFPAVVPEEGLAQWLASGAANWAAPAGSQRKALVSPTLAPDDLFPVVWPHIAARLANWPAHEELARQLCIEVAQLRVWLERAAAQGLIKGDLRAITGDASAAAQARFKV